MADIEWNDVQGFVRRGMGWLRNSSYVLLEVTHKELARTWLGRLPLTSAADVAHRSQREDMTFAVNIAVTFPGLVALGFDPGSPAGFSREFFEGMVPRGQDAQGLQKRRSNMLGDVGPNDPRGWAWGGLKEDTKPVHVILLAFGRDDLETRVGELLNPGYDTGVQVITTLPGWLPEDMREHFNFRDGLSQPRIHGDEGAALEGASARLHLTAPGEFLIGYKNERGHLPVSPQMPDGQDFGRNGSYFVLRELGQDVQAFESWLDDQATAHTSGDRAQFREWIAAKMIGRWRSGAPLTQFPDMDRSLEESGSLDGEDATPSNDFFYHSEDREGFRCPIGAHVRRAWPRDGLGSDPDRALQQTRLHRILRRGRLFGPAYDRADPKSLSDKSPRGLHFGCFNADISSQFESVQHNWINTPNFSGLANERDPLVGERDTDTIMTIQHTPVNLRLRGLSTFVRTRGGAYFFMPGLAAVERLASL